MAENFFSSMPAVAWGCDVSHIDYEKILGDSLFAMHHMHPHGHEGAKYMDPHGAYAVSCEDLEAFVSWDQLLRPHTMATVPSSSNFTSSSASPCVAPGTDSDDTELARHASPETKQGRSTRKRLESAGSQFRAQSPADLSPTPKRRRSSSRSSSVPMVKSKRARALEMMIKRDSHNDSERQRRSEMKDGLQQLKAVLPPMQGMNRMNTGQLLEYAINTIKEVVAEEKRLAAEKDALKAELLKLHGSDSIAV